MTVEERLDQLEKRNRRLTAALTLMAVAICAVVTVAATGDKIGRFDALVARIIWVENDAGDVVVGLGTDDGGSGLVTTYSAERKELVKLTSTVNNYGIVNTYQPNGKEVVRMTAGNGGGGIEVYNKTGERIVTIHADEYGNGVVGAFNRKGMGRTLTPGP